MTNLPRPMAEFDADFKRILAAAPVQDREAHLASLALHYSQRTLVHEMISGICSDNSLMVWSAQRSTRHPLGFDKFLLHATDVYQLRLHVWWPEDPHGTEHIHNHRFSFLSGVVLGRIKVSSYRSMSGGAQYGRFIEDRQAGGGMYEYRSEGYVKVALANFQSLGPGSAYYLDSGELHRVHSVDDGLSATLFIRLSQARGNTDVLVGPDDEIPAAGLRANMAVTELKQRLESFIHSLALP